MLISFAVAFFIVGCVFAFGVFIGRLIGISVGMRRAMRIVESELQGGAILTKSELSRLRGMVLDDSPKDLS